MDVSDFQKIVVWRILVDSFAEQTWCT